MFELKRSQKICEQLKVGDEVIDINIDAGEIQTRFIKSYNAVIRAEKALQQAMADNLEATAECLEEYGRAITSVLQVVFGVDNTVKIIAFYEQNYLEMFSEVYPFITGVILPKIQEVAIQKANELKALYKGKR